MAGDTVYTLVTHCHLDGEVETAVYKSQGRARVELGSMLESEFEEGAPLPDLTGPLPICIKGYYHTFYLEVNKIL